MEPLIYKRKVASTSDIYEHLKKCSKHPVPALDTRVDIQNYAKKLFDYAQTFECWNSGDLVGLLAIYCNDKNYNSSFISNLSVISSHYKQNIASQLLERCIEYTKILGFDSINLEVHIGNIAALSLYKKYGFSQFLYHSNDEKSYYIQMKKNLNS